MQNPHVRAVVRSAVAVPVRVARVRVRVVVVGGESGASGACALEGTLRTAPCSLQARAEIFASDVTATVCLPACGVAT